ncbi:MAG: acyl carrier protein [Bacteroidales bacterium]|nr:acyl carrier protein [Candidatus Cacconaster equifaecalis]MCQ2170865.1 acyl carrier protein [Bacteroidales bacterium]
MFDEVQKILAKQLRIDPSRVQIDSRIQADLGADSLNILQLLMKIEDDYGIVIPDEELADFETVRDVVNYLDSQKKDS